MYVYAWPSTSAFSYTDVLQTETYQAEVALATQLRAALEQVLRDASGARPEPIRVVQAAVEYLPVLTGLYNSLLTDTLLVRKEMQFLWRSALGRGAKFAMHGLYAEVCQVHMLLGMSLCNEAASAVATLGVYELDPSVHADMRQQRDERLRVAADLLCRASGVFEYVALQLLPRWDMEQPRPPELTRDVALALARLAMADAHRLALRKLQSPALALATDTLTPGPPLPAGHPSPALLAKLHLHAASLYEQSASLIYTHERHAPGPHAEPMARARQSMYKLKASLQTRRPDAATPIDPAIARYAEHESRWHRALAHKWLGIDAGENAASPGAGLAHLAAAREQLHKLVPRSAELGAELKRRIPLWEQRRAAKFHNDLALWWMGVEEASVARWLDVYRRLNDTVSFQRVPPLSELQYASEGRAALVAKPYTPPTPGFGPQASDMLDPTACLGIQNASETQSAYAGAGAYY